MLKATYFAVDPQFLNLLSNFSSVYRHNLSHAEVSLYLLKPDMHGAFMQYLGTNKFNFSQEEIILPHFLGWEAIK